MKVYLREYFGYNDVLLTTLLFLGFVGLTVPNLGNVRIWGVMGLGILGYILIEYLTHRFLFHMKPPQNPTMLKFMKRIHYDHHVKPKELELLFLPVWYSFPNMAVAGGAAYWVTGNAATTFAFMTGVVGTLLYYEWTHFVAHRPIKPLTPWGRWMKKVHLWHHYKNERFWFGVTNPLFDVMMGTFKDEKEVEKSETARNLEA